MPGGCPARPSLPHRDRTVVGPPSAACRRAAAQQLMDENSEQLTCRIPQQRVPMLKLSVFLTRRDDLTHDEFTDYWTQKHTPLLASLPPGAVQVHRYVQLLPTQDVILGVTTADYDGVAELWVASVDEAASWFTSEAYRTDIAADEENFLDRSKTRFLYSTESVIFS
jgi:uncharacterized protein (TIGR02118 family)